MASLPLVALHGQALQQLQHGDYGGAAVLLRRLLLHLPVNHEARADVLVVLAFAELEARSVEEALSVARHALTLAPRNEHARRAFARAQLAALLRGAR